MLILSGWLHYKTWGSKRAAFFSWFGGLLGMGAVSCGIGGYCLFLGVFHWPVAAAVFISGIYALWRFIRSWS
jgi:hypothetical protein